MSTSPPPRRRRIAGERRRPSTVTPSTKTARPSETSRPPTSDEPSRLPGPPGADSTNRPGLRERLRRSRAQKHGTVPVEPSGDGPAGRPSWWGSLQSIIALAVALVVMSTLVGLGAFGLLGNVGVLDVQRSEDAQVARESAPSVAERAAQAILAYDHRSLDSDQDAAERFMTSSFAEEYASTFEKTVRPPARSYKAKVTSEVRGSSVIRADADRVRVLLFVDQTTRSTAHQRPQVALNRVEFDMVERDGDWLVDDISSY